MSLKDICENKNSHENFRIYSTFLVLTNLGSFYLETAPAEQVMFYSKGQYRFVTDRRTDFAARAHRHSNH